MHAQIRFIQFAVIVVLAGVATAGRADGAPGSMVTFTKDVMSILQENCQICHRPGGDSTAGMVAPMSLMTYSEVRPWAKAIAKAVSERVMPPWDATADTHGVFVNERSLTDEEISTILRWVETGAARGNPQDMPEVKEFPANNGWIIGIPD